MRRRLAGLAGAFCGLCLMVGCTSDAVGPDGHDRVLGPRLSAPAWPGAPSVEIAGQPTLWWPVAVARDLQPTGIDVVASSGGVGEMVVDGAGAIWVDLPWGLARLDPVTWSASTWDAGDDAAFVGNRFVRASAASGIWLVEQDRARLFDGVRFVRDIQVPAACLGQEGDDQQWTPDREGIRDLVEVGSELWIASEDGLARCDGHRWSTVDEGRLHDVQSLLAVAGEQVWAGSSRSSLSTRWLRYDGTGWTAVDTRDAWGVRTMAGDPAGGIVAASDRQVLRYDGSTWRTLLQLDDDEGEDAWVRAVAASGDGTVWVVISGDAAHLLRSNADGGWTSIAAPDGTGLSGLAVSGDEVVVSSDTGVYRVAADRLEPVWSPRPMWAVVPDITDVVSVSGDEAWIVTTEWSEEREAPALRMQRVHVGRPGPVLVASLPASMEATWSWPRSALGAAAVAASDGAIWRISDDSVLRIADGTKSEVATGLGGYLTGEHRLNVDVVATQEGEPVDLTEVDATRDPRPREIGPDGFARVAVGGAGVEQTLYGDGDVSCPDHWAHDLSLPVGRVEYTPALGTIEIVVTLDKAWPNTEYYVEVNTDQFCRAWESGDLQGETSPFWGLTTDGDGAGSLTLSYVPRSPTSGARLLAGDDGTVWLMPSGRLPRWFAHPEQGGRKEEADWEGLCLLAPDGQCTPVELPAPTRDIMSLAAGPGGILWATVCDAGTQPGGWGDRMCPAGRQLMRWEAGWMPVAYPGADMTGLGATPDSGFWGILAATTGEFEGGVLAHYGEGSWTTFPELAGAGPWDYTVAPDGSVCRIADEGPDLVCVDTSLQVSRTSIDLDGTVAVAADGAVWVWDNDLLVRVPITVP